jgi:hypothetical protein
MGFRRRLIPSREHVRFGEQQVAGEDEGGVLVSAGDELEEQVGGVPARTADQVTGLCWQARMAGLLASCRAVAACPGAVTVIPRAHTLAAVVSGNLHGHQSPLGQLSGHHDGIITYISGS